MTDEAEARAAVDTGLRNIVDELATKIGPGEAAMILQFVDHDEPGVAYEMLRDLLIEEQTPLPPAAWTALVDLARSMDLDAREAELRPALGAA